ncbi:uncharacterized protein K444DRAFT_620252 [Hyaloscypha bicolor E]|uniref:DDE-1 domain-containing protein n=1 Tax=Hyaloscypha bicolor E TaxID=1095630 RepID=A0A2J6SK01_9HELO|nr:uncharacterized protein K444DRAFT_620252 [Hyaloscypha bicolor E]PMD51084.1 hypothetical protein K444DRAFT_620252 [Hyaloscypha bicolor E]
MTKYDPEEEKRMAQASDFYARNPHVKKSAIARQFREGVKQFIDFLIYLGHKANLKTVQAAANKILAESASTHQVTPWFKTLRAKILVQKRKAANRKEDLEEHFNKYYGALEKFGICFKDMWNMDETGFRISVLNRKIIIIYLNTKAVYLADPNNRESLTTIETISARGEVIILFLILKGEILLEEYFNNDLNAEIVFAISSTRYINNALSLKYIKDKEKYALIPTKPKLLRASLIMERELVREKAGRKHVQKYGVISKEFLFTAKEMNNNAYLNRRIKETNTYIIKHITTPYDLGEPFGYGDKPLFINYGNTELFHANKMDFRLASPGYEEEWVSEFGDMRVEMLARELGFVRPLPNPSLFYNNGFGNIVRLDTNGEEIIIRYTK